MTSPNECRTQARAIMIGDRFFCRFGKVGQVQTAWSLAGAQLYLPDTHHHINADTSRLDRLAKKYRIVMVQLAEEKGATP
ncbi:hypothetical protein [Xanthobacter aminoxidans]|uniref:hypothetical protein n=1 Tax=Xanthobacter aminoxidans TaxID=186280 RepID=UPI00202318CA|nr:hypothetical protein [Xanthobacter aminoxidans]MCL8385511.1 hypothetical protein [Xanthobacter aminoxidans]